MNTRMHPITAPARVLRPLLGTLLLLLAWGSATPASAESGIISGTRVGPIYVYDTETLYITKDAQITADQVGVVVFGGTLIVSGGSISSNYIGMEVKGGTVSINGGAISGQYGVVVHAGTVSISGGSISGTALGVNTYGGTVSIYGCGLQLSNYNQADAVGLLTGTLQDGTLINTLARVSPTSLISTCAYTWSGFLPPINVDGSSIFKLGRTVPVKFALTGASAGITDLVARLWVAKVSNGVVGTDAEADSTAAATTGNLFRYDSSGVYIFNMGTSGLTAGTYALRVDLGDGDMTHTVLISLR